MVIKPEDFFDNQIKFKQRFKRSRGHKILTIVSGEVIDVATCKLKNGRLSFKLLATSSITTRQFRKCIIDVFSRLDDIVKAQTSVIGDIITLGITKKYQNNTEDRLLELIKLRMLWVPVKQKVASHQNEDLIDDEEMNELFTAASTYPLKPYPRRRKKSSAIDSDSYIEELSSQEDQDDNFSEMIPESRSSEALASKETHQQSMNRSTFFQQDSKTLTGKRQRSENYETVNANKKSKYNPKEDISTEENLIEAAQSIIIDTDIEVQDDNSFINENSSDSFVHMPGLFFSEQETTSSSIVSSSITEDSTDNIELDSPNDFNTEDAEFMHFYDEKNEETTFQDVIMVNSWFK